MKPSWMPENPYGKFVKYRIESGVDLEDDYDKGRCVGFNEGATAGAKAVLEYLKGMCMLLGENDNAEYVKGVTEALIEQMLKELNQ